MLTQKVIIGPDFADVSDFPDVSDVPDVPVVAVPDVPDVIVPYSISLDLIVPDALISDVLVSVMKCV